MIEKKRLASIKENAEFARNLGLPVSQKKFDRHVSRIDTRTIEPHSSSENEEDSSDSDSDKKKRKIKIQENLELFKVKYEETESLKSFVHGEIFFTDVILIRQIRE